MKKFPITLLYLLLHLATLAQKEVPDFGKIAKEDLLLSDCSFEPGAAALKLFDVTETEFSYDNYGSRIKTEKRVRIKIFKESGYASATVKIPYYSKKSVSKIKALHGVVYNLNAAGNMVAQLLEGKDFFRNQATDNVGLVMFTFPNVKPGSVVEFSYTRIEHDMVVLDAWEVQDKLPARYVANTIIIPETSRLKSRFFGMDSVSQYVQPISGSRQKHIYFKEEVASFRPEPFMTSFRDNLLRVSYLLIPRGNSFIDALTAPDRVWKFVGYDLLGAANFGGQMLAPIPGTDSLLAAARQLPLVKDRISFIFNAVKKRCPDKPEQVLSRTDVAATWQAKSGNSSDVNVLLINLLRKANVACFPILISTRGHGQISMDFPSTSQFNGVDVLAADSNRLYLLDAGADGQTANLPPANVLNRVALLLDRDSIRWVRLTDDRLLTRQEISIQACLTEDGDLRGNAATAFFDYARLQALDSTEKETVDDKAKKPVGLEILHYQRLPSVSDDDVLQEKTAFVLQPQKTGDFSFVDPQFLMQLKKNPFLSDTRLTDIDFGSNQLITLTLAIDVPPTHTIEDLPKNILLRAPDSTFFYKRTCVRTASGLTFTQTFEIKQAIFYREDYPAVKEFFKKMYGLMGEEIIFKKAK